jgi:multidrug resistance efflux pump
MKKFIYIFFLIEIVFAAEHYARVEPLERYTIKSSVSGEIIWTSSNLEGEIVNGEIIKIDSKIDKKDLQNALNTKEIIKKSLDLAKEILPTLEENYKRQLRYFKRLSQTSSTSQNQKDLAFGAMVSAKNQFISTKDKILSLKRQLSDIDFKIAMLKDKISKKSIRAKNLYLYKLFVKKGDYATFGKPLAILDDLSKAKVTIYLSKDELRNLSKSKIYIQGQKTNLTFNKIWKEADEKFISSYKAEIILEPKYQFSSLIKVEVK